VSQTHTVSHPKIWKFEAALSINLDGQASRDPCGSTNLTALVQIFVPTKKISRAKAQSATAFLKAFFASLREKNSLRSEVRKCI